VYSLLTVLKSILTPSASNTMLIAPAALNATHVEARITGRNSSLKVVAPFMMVMLLFCMAAIIYLGYCNTGKNDDRPCVADVSDASKKLRGMVFEKASGKTLEAKQITEIINAPMGIGDRWRKRDTREGFAKYFAFGAVLVLATGFLRLRFPRFPLHPLPLVLIGSWLMSRYWSSFLVGWAIKKVILKIGGSRLFEKARPFFTGVIVGQAFVCLLWVVVNIIIDWNNGQTFESKWWAFMYDIYSSAGG
jgi:hypothetical protein